MVKKLIYGFVDEVREIDAAVKRGMCRFLGAVCAARRLATALRRLSRLAGRFAMRFNGEARAIKQAVIPDVALESGIGNGMGKVAW